MQFINCTSNGQVNKQVSEINLVFLTRKRFEIAISGLGIFRLAAKIRSSRLSVFKLDFRFLTSIHPSIFKLKKGRNNLRKKTHIS